RFARACAPRGLALRLLRLRPVGLALRAEHVLYSLCASCRLQVPRLRHPESFQLSPIASRSEEHTSELQSRGHLVCRLLLEKKKQQDEGRQLHVAAAAPHRRLAR